MSDTISKITIEGFKSIRKLQDFRLGPINVLIGANGAGKSNFIGFFHLLRDLVEQRLQLAVQIEGGADACLHLGAKVTPRLRARLVFGRNAYRFTLIPTKDNRLVFADETTVFNPDLAPKSRELGSGHTEARLKSLRDDPGVWTPQNVAYHVYNSISGWTVYHFHDTSPEARVRRQGAINDNESLRTDGANLAAFLWRIQQTDLNTYLRIRDAVRLAAPFFEDFKLRPIPSTPGEIQLDGCSVIPTTHFAHTNFPMEHSGLFAWQRR